MQVHRVFQFPIKSEITFEHNLLASLFACYREMPCFFPAIGIINIPSMSFFVCDRKEYFNDKSNYCSNENVKCKFEKFTPNKMHLDGVIMRLKCDNDDDWSLWFAVTFIGIPNWFFIPKAARSAFMIDSNYGAFINQIRDGTNANKIKENYNDKIIYASFAFYCTIRERRIDVLTLTIRHQGRTVNLRFPRKVVFQLKSHKLRQIKFVVNNSPRYPIDLAAICEVVQMS
jgi:hypothetical protein